MRDVKGMIEKMEEKIGNEIPEEIDLSIREFSALNELAENTGEARLYHLISNSFLFGMACAYDHLAGERDHIDLNKGFLDHIWERYLENMSSFSEHEDDTFSVQQKMDEAIEKDNRIPSYLYFAAGIDAANRIRTGELKINKFMALK